LVALPGQIVVTHPDLSSSDNEQLVACSTRLPKNVPPRISTFSLNTFEERSHAMPAPETMKYEKC
jgi:hypothetical protein